MNDERPRYDGGSRDDRGDRARGNNSGYGRSGDSRSSRGGDSRPPFRSNGDRPQRDGERRPYGDRPQRDGERRPFGDRPQRDGERRPFGDRPQRDGERRPFNGGGERRPYGDRPQRDGERRPFNGGGERRPYGDRPQRDGERRPYGDRPQRDGERRPFNGGGERRPYGDRPQRDGERRPYGDRPQRDGERRPFASDRPQRDGERRPYGDRPQRDGDYRPRSFSERPERNESRPYGDRAARTDDFRPSRDSEATRKQERHNEPELEEHITGTNLDKSVKRDLGTLNEDNSLIVARHLEAAAYYLDEDPERALEHALAAKRRASRLAVVRETVGLLAYVTEDFATALSELRAFQRISGSEAQVAIIIDCLRALDRSEDALKIARALDRSSLPGEAQIDLAIVLSGIRLDRGEADRALAELQIPQLDPTKATVECVALFDANAEVLEELGRTEDAAQWRRYARLTEAAYAPDETMTVETERLFTEEELEGDGVNLDTIDPGYEPPMSDEDELDELLDEESDDEDEDSSEDSSEAEEPKGK